MSMFSSWWSGESSANEAKEPTDTGAGVADTGKAALDGLWNVVSQVKNTVSQTVEKGVPNVFVDFNKEEEKFKKEKKGRHTDAAVPPWVGYNEEEMMRTQILALSTDKRNFLRNPPPGVQFHFDFNVSFPVAMAILSEDPMLEKMRFELVPKQVNEECFWRNYFYRVSLIKQSSQLTSLAAAQKEDSDVDKQSETSSEAVQVDTKTEPVAAQEELPDQGHDEEGANEFISDTFVSDQADRGAISEAVPEWEKELQEDLKEFGLDDLDSTTPTDGAENDDAQWEKEIEAMLDMDDSLKSS